MERSWKSLEGWGGGDVQVIVDYTGNGFSGSQTRTLSAADGMRGTAVTCNETASIGNMNNTNGPARYLTGVSRVQVKRSDNHPSELQPHLNLVCRLRLQNKKNC